MSDTGEKSMEEAGNALRRAMKAYGEAVGNRYARDPYFTQRQALAAFSRFHIPRSEAMQYIRANALAHNEALRIRRTQQ